VKEWCLNHGNIQNFETSAKDASNVECAFQEIAKAAAAYCVDEEM
jgi:Ras-related protein Rab-7A